MPECREPKDEIIDATLALADRIGWENVHLHAVADRLGVPLAELRRQFPDLDAVGNAWIGRADLAMLSLRDDPAFRALPERERIFRVVTAWLDALGGRRATVAAILGYKLRPSHLHHQAALVVSLSRTVQWVREAAGLEATGGRRDREEVALTLLFVATVLVWLQDRSAQQDRTRRFLRQRLGSRVARQMWPQWPPGIAQPRPGPGPAADATEGAPPPGFGEAI